MSKKDFSPFLSEKRRKKVTGMKPNLSSGEAVGSPRIPDQTKQLAVCTRQFHDAMVIRRPRFWKLRNDALALVEPTMVPLLELRPTAFLGYAKGHTVTLEARC